MGKKLPPDERELYRRVDEVLHYLWDPIGVAGEPGARDEYEEYLPRVFSILTKGADEQEIAKYLISVERDSMGLEGNAAKALRTAEILIEYRTWISDRTS
jgi:hypothetical protein